MKNFFLGVFAALLASAALGAAAVYSGSVDVAADEPHHPLVFSLLATAREQAIEQSAKGITVPVDLTDSERVRRGAGNYAAMCATCHLSPGETDSELRTGLYPQPPDLTRGEEGAEGTAAASQFWVIKHGVKATAMAAWARGGLTDENIWDMVAFVQALPGMGPAEYQAWVAASDGHSHGDTAMQEHQGHAHDQGHDPAHEGHNHGGHAH